MVKSHLIRLGFTLFLYFIYKYTVSCSENKSSESRLALIITLSSRNKLVEYFEWSCRSIGASKHLVDLLVFHENNERIKNINCAPNVKFINIGENGLAEAIVHSIVDQESSNAEVLSQLIGVVNNIMLHIPMYLVEVKPMMGFAFKKYLKDYSHWSSTDPDIIWGRLDEWIDPADAEEYDILTIAENLDSGRLYLRNQVIHLKPFPDVGIDYLFSISLNFF